MAPSASDAQSDGLVGGAADAAEVSVVICTKNHPADLAKAIASVRASGEAGRRAEIVVVDESDAPCEVADVRYVPHRRRGGGFGATRNVGVRAARGRLIVFLDDDCEAEPAWVERLIAPLVADPAVLGAAGAVLVKDCGAIGYAENILGFPGGGLRYLHEAQGRPMPIRFLSTCNCAYRKDVLLRVGGFPEEPVFQRPGGEDSILAEKVSLQGPCVFVPDAVIYHKPRGTLGSVFRWFIGRGQSDINFRRVTPRPWLSTWYLLRSSLALRLAGFLVLLGVWPECAVLAPVAFGIYYGAILLRYRFALAYPAHRSAWWIVPIVKMAMDLGAEVGRWKAVFFRER